MGYHLSDFGTEHRVVELHQAHLLALLAMCFELVEVEAKLHLAILAEHFLHSGCGLPTDLPQHCEQAAQDDLVNVVSVQEDWSLVQHIRHHFLDLFGLVGLERHHSLN